MPGFLMQLNGGPLGRSFQAHPKALSDNYDKDFKERELEQIFYLFWLKASKSDLGALLAFVFTKNLTKE